MNIYPLPQFVEGVHWRRLTPEEGRNKWRYVLLQPITFHIIGYAPRYPDLKIEFRDKYRRVWATLHGREFTTMPGYASNGNSPKRHVRIFGRGVWVGTPDFEGDVNGNGGTVLANFLHDPARQFARTKHMPLSLKDHDDLFLSILKAVKFRWARLWYHTVRAASGVWPIDQHGQTSAVVSNFSPP